MIEAVNAATASVALSQSTSSQTDVQVSASASPLEEIGDAPQAPRAPFVSPFIAVDTEFDRAVLQIRNGDTGEVIRQFPSEGRLENQARETERIERSERLRENSPIQNRVEASPEVIAVQDVTVAPATNQPAVTTQNAINALSAGVETAQTVQTSSVTVTA